MKKTSILRLFALTIALLSICLCFASCDASSKGDNMSMESEMEKPNDAGSGLVDTEQSLTQAPIEERKVIKTFDISSETKDFDAAIASLNTLVAQCGGYVESASSYNKSLNNSSTSYTRRATYTVRIPAEQAETFIGSVGTLFHVTSNNSYVEDVSETYYSIEARLEELKIERDSLLDILDQTDTKSDYSLWLTVQERLSDVRQQIAVYQGQLNRYDSKIAYSTVNLTVSEVINYSEVSGDNSFGSRLGASFKGGWNNFAEAIQDVTIWFAGALPFLMVWAIFAVIVIVILVTVNKKKKRSTNNENDNQP